MTGSLWIRRQAEALLVRLAAWILMGRNVHRCRVVTRRDNNDMWYMAERLYGIADRIAQGYRPAADGSPGKVTQNALAHCDSPIDKSSDLDN